MGAFEEACLSVVEPKIKLDDGDSFWRLEEPVLDPDGKIKVGGLFPHQREWWDLPNFIKMLVGGYGAGKTFVGAKRMIASALHNAPCMVAAVSPSFRIGRRTTIATIRELLGGKRSILGRTIGWKYNASSHEFRIRYKGRDATIIICSGDDPDSLRGPNLAAAWIDEPFIQDEDVFHQMIARVRHPDAALKEIILTGTPEQLNWGYDIVLGEDAGKHDVGMVQAHTSKNLALDEDYVERLKGAFDGKAGEAYIAGHFVNLAEGIVYYGFNPNIHSVDQDAIPDSAEIGVGMDFNVNPMAMCAFWRTGSRMHFFKEWELSNADTEYACQVLREEFGERLQNIYPDATGSARHTSAPGGRSDFHFIREAGFTVCAPGRSPKVKDRYNAVNAKFRPLDGRPLLTVSPKCRRLRKYLSIYSHELKNDADHKAMSHLLDAFSYAVCYLFPVMPAVRVHKIKGA